MKTEDGPLLACLTQGFKLIIKNKNRGRKNRGRASTNFKNIWKIYLIKNVCRMKRW